MRELMKTNDAVLLTFVESILRGEGIEPLVLDRNMSIMEGSIGILPRRVLVADDQWSRARRLLAASGVELGE
ncbi:MAG TPA: DUF2007 domain-containing protein [Hyphomicrobiales bacterium]|nr:DUF2007 domain-containing protein [Rhodobiaceae bacterium]HXK53045.1 DUF2007 domain-containing protein [Hyphomicrobiales bacterium]